MNKKTYRVKIPATSANFGSGFDTIGAAFKLYNTFEFREIDEGLVIKGCEKEFQTEENLIYQSMLEVFNRTGYTPKGICIYEDNKIPVGKGLGSSTTCIVGGLIGANLIAGEPLSKGELCDIAVELEGHPDNIAPAFYGGIIAALLSDGETFLAKEQLAPNFSFYACIPDFRLPTKKARKILPQNYTRQDVVYNVSHALLTFLALTAGDANFIPTVIGDKIHEPYRRNLIPGIDLVEKGLKEAEGLASFISGAGPTIMLISETNNNQFDSQMRSFLENNLPEWQFIKLLPDTNGVEYEELCSTNI